MHTCCLLRSCLAASYDADPLSLLTRKIEVELDDTHRPRRWTLMFLLPRCTLLARQFTDTTLTQTQTHTDTDTDTDTRGDGDDDDDDVAATSMLTVGDVASDMAEIHRIC